MPNTNSFFSWAFPACEEFLPQELQEDKPQPDLPAEVWQEKKPDPIRCWYATLAMCRGAQ